MKERRKYMLSLDVSTTNVGIALWDLDEDGGLVELKHLGLKHDNKIDSEFRDLYKAELLKEYFISYKKRINYEFNGDVREVIIEAPLSNTPKNINTTALLLGFNGISRYIMYTIFGMYPRKITVHEARKLMCPELVRKVKRKGKIEEILSFPINYRTEKKLYVWKKVSKLEPQIKWFYKKNKKDEIKDICFDMSDAYAVGYAWLKKSKIIK